MFITEDFLLDNAPARALYHTYARDLPIVDFHNHLSPQAIADDYRFEHLQEIWLAGDHYKWRAMRANGVDEHYITGDAAPEDKFLKWAETVPYTIRNPLYHWTHMELEEPFGIRKLLTARTARFIYEEATERLQTPSYSVRNLLRRANAEVLCTTDDPSDDLAAHRQIAASDFEIQVLPTFRPDAALALTDPERFNAWTDRLAERADIDISRFEDLLDALQKRHNAFHAAGCRQADHGLARFYAAPYQTETVRQTFDKVRAGHVPAPDEAEQYQSAVLHRLAVMHHEKDWAQHFHIGALRNNNTRLQHLLGADVGADSMGDWELARPMARFFDRLDREGRLARTIVYNHNPRDNAVFATMMGNFNDGSVPGKMQFGTSWWFLDQERGLIAQLNDLSDYGLLGRFIGMTTDSRSFLSFSRHTYFRRVLCNLIGQDIVTGRLPNDLEFLGSMIRGICYKNAKGYFGFKSEIISVL